MQDLSVPSSPGIDRRLSLRVVVTLAVIALAASGAPSGNAVRAQGDDTQPSILVLSVDDVTRSYMRLLFQAFTDTVSAAPNRPAVYFESLDASRFEKTEYLESLREWLRHKYREKQIDLVVAIGEDALAFLAAERGEPWPVARVLYFESGSVRVDTRSSLPHAGGLLLEDSFAGAMHVLQTVLPETRRLALVYGASSIERERYGGFAAKTRNARLDPIEIVVTTIAETRVAVASLPEQTVVLVLGPIVDAAGEVLTPVRVCESLAALGKAPVLTTEMNNFGCGALGGLLRDWSIIGRRLGEEALARLKTSSTDVVTVPIARFTTIAFDDRQLERWRIPEGRLPAGAVIQFREPNFWRDRRGLVITVAAVTLLQSFLIVGLVFERRRRRQAEIDSRRNLVALAHLDRRAAMGELATSLAHELNQPLNAILQNAGVAQMMLGSTTVPPALGEMADIIGDIRKDDIRASEMIRRMRGLLQKHELEARPVDLNELAVETAAIVRPDARSRKVELEMNLSDPVTPVLGDRIHLQQVLLNLLINAMDAVATMRPERRRVRISTSQLNGTVRLAVTDTGIGIPADRIQKIFEPFYTTKGEEKGMGMGLPIARNIVEAHGGRMDAENNRTGGATVWFTMPAPPARQM